MTNKPILTWLREERQLIHNRAVDLCMWKIIAPGAVLFFFLPIYAIFMEIDHPVIRAFGHGDYILFAALLYIEISMESERSLRQDATARIARNTFRILGLFLIIVFAFWKNEAVIKEAGLASASAANATAILDKLYAYAVLSCAIALLATAQCINSVLKSVERECSDLYLRLAGEA